MTATTTTQTVRNGVDTTTMFATLDAIKAQPEIAQFRFRARNQWLGGAHNRSTIKDFYAACDEDTSRTEAFTLDAGEPAILLGVDDGPNPAEYLLHALAACVTTSLVYSAAARGLRPRSCARSSRAAPTAPSSSTRSPTVCRSRSTSSRSEQVRGGRPGRPWPVASRPARRRPRSPRRRSGRAGNA